MGEEADYLLDQMVFGQGDDDDSHYADSLSYARQRQQLKERPNRTIRVSKYVARTEKAVLVHGELEIDGVVTIVAGRWIPMSQLFYRGPGDMEPSIPDWLARKIVQEHAQAHRTVRLRGLR